MFNPIPPSTLRKIFDSYLNNGDTTLIFSDVCGNLSIEYLVEIFSKILLEIFTGKISHTGVNILLRFFLNLNIYKSNLQNIDSKNGRSIELHPPRLFWYLILFNMKYKKMSGFLQLLKNEEDDLPFGRCIATSFACQPPNSNRAFVVTISSLRKKQKLLNKKDVEETNY